ncbi:MAG: PQQ-binding-like beta-propeller repeat protein [Verrucomicrobiota bacterium]
MKLLAILGLCAGALALRCIAADEWPQFRGPDGQGRSDAIDLPLTWSETENVKWKSAIPGEGWASPVVSGSQIWMTTATDAGKSLRAVCVDFETGKLLKDVEVFHIETPRPKHPLNSYASPSPIIENGQLYVHFGNYGTACLSTDTGMIVWQRQDLLFNDQNNGPGGTPVLWKNHLIFSCDGTDVRFVIALDKHSGKTVWKTDRSYKGDKPPNMPAYGTPLVANVNGMDQVVAPGTNRVAAYDPDTGKELWFVNYIGFSEAARPIFGDGLLYVSAGHTRTLYAIRPDGAGDITSPGVVWKTNQQACQMPSPVLVGNRFYMIGDDTGVASCLDSATGREIWKEKIGGKFCASLLAAGDRVYFFDRDGLTTVVGAGDSFKVLAKNQLESGFMSSAAVAGKALVLRTKTHLYRIEK